MGINIGATSEQDNQRRPLKAYKKKTCKKQKCSKWKGGKCQCGKN